MCLIVEGPVLIVVVVGSNRASIFMTLMMLDAHTNAAVASSVGVAVVFCGGFGFCLSCAMVLVFLQARVGVVKPTARVPVNPAMQVRTLKLNLFISPGRNFELMIGSRFSLRTSPL